ncbi:endonuclease domain-containing protein [Longimycelium tulufanense]|uniref:endonuclease domain-containing protein n=1 Tax=Longimycelium tulufanense TaxID=907463 RepID=UPI00166A01E7
MGKPVRGQRQRRCARCLEDKPLAEFVRDAGRPGGAWSYCRTCHRDYQRQRRHHLTDTEIRDFYASHGHDCRICGTPEKETAHGRLVIDHDHATGLIRGLLCDLCNKALGMIRDDVVILKSALAYLEQHEEIRTNDAV